MSGICLKFFLTIWQYVVFEEEENNTLFLNSCLKHFFKLSKENWLLFS